MEPGPSSVLELSRYPVKSMGGEEVRASTVSERGFLGDRAWAVTDTETGKVASAKRPAQWGQLLECSAEFTTEPATESPLPPVRIRLPDGQELITESSDVDVRLSEFLGRSVRLATPDQPAVFEVLEPDASGLNPADLSDTSRVGVDDTESAAVSVTDIPLAVFAPGTFMDLAPIHLVTTATLARLAQLGPESRFDSRRFRPNLVIDIGAITPSFVETTWVGQTLRIGEVELAVQLVMPRCIMTTLPQGDLPRDRRVLQSLATHNRVDFPGFGVYPGCGVAATVTKAGVIRHGDPVVVCD